MQIMVGINAQQREDLERMITDLEADNQCGFVYFLLFNCTSVINDCPVSTLLLYAFILSILCKGQISIFWVAKTDLVS